MSTRIFRNVDGILAVERDGVLIYGPTKVFRAVDITIETKPAEHWIALALAEWRGFDDATCLAITSASRIELIIGGKAAVFGATSTASEASVKDALATFVPPLSEIDTARAALRLWRDDPTKVAMTKSDVLNVFKLLGV